MMEPASDQPQIEKNRIGGGALRLVLDPFLHQRQSVGCLVDIVAIGDILERPQDLFEAVDSGAQGGLQTFPLTTVELILG
jgi:hypothetical protein